MPILIGILLLLYPSFLPAQKKDLRDEIMKIIQYDTEINLERDPGFILAVIDGDATYYLPFGTVDQYGMQPDSSSLYEIGSVTKSMTALLCITLAENGILRLDGSVNSYLPRSSMNVRMDGVTIHDLLTHQSGLPKRPGGFGKHSKQTRDPYRNFDRDQLLKNWRDFVLDEEIGFAYSHMGYGILEIIIEQVTDMSFEDAMQRWVLEPIDMMDTYVYSTLEDSLALAPGYDKAQRTSHPWQFASHSASEGAKSSARDLVRYIIAMMNTEQSPKLSSAIRTLQNIQVHRSMNDHISTAYGWQVYHRSKDAYPIYSYTGRTSGHSVFVAFVSETRTGIILLSSSGVGPQRLGMDVLRLINYNWNRT